MIARRIALILAIGAPLAIGPVAPAAAQQSRALVETRDQGVLYYKKKRFKQARRYLDRAYAMKGGLGDFSTVYYRGMTAFALGQIDLAYAMAAAAEPLAVDDARKRRVKDLGNRIRELYGPVTFKASPNETNARGRIFFEAKTGIINKDKKERFAAVQERYQTTSVELPATLMLPYGEFTANGIPFAVVERAEKPPVVGIFLQVVDDEEEGGTSSGGLDSSTWVWIGVGAAAAVGIGVGVALLVGGDEDPLPPPTRVDASFE